jgi:biotin carboxylase
MLRCLAEMRIEGLKTNTALHSRILLDPNYQKGEFNTTFVTRKLADAGREAA